MRNPFKRRIYGDEINYEAAQSDFKTWSDLQSPERWILAANRALRLLDLESVPESYEYEYHLYIEALENELGKMRSEDIREGMTKRGQAKKSINNAGSFMFDPV